MQTRLRGRAHRRGPAAEQLSRPRRVRGATYFRSRQEHETLTIVVSRFPSREEVPAEDAPAFVLVHGLGVSARYFGPLAAELARRGPVYVVDLPGYGAAPNPRRAVPLVDHARVLAGMLIELGLRDPVLVGHSMGSQIVSLLAAEHPEITDRIVLMAPTMEPERRGFWNATGRLLADAFREPPIVFLIAFGDYLFRCGLRYLLQQTPYMLGDRVEDRMPGLDARVLVLCGDRDTIVSTAWGRALAEQLRDGEFHEISGAHVVMHTDPVTVARHIVDHAAR
ncbi:MAG: alpha/beta fold hydrolase [Microbacteriaceae bacterium]